MTAPSEIDAARARLEDGHANMLRMRVGSAQGVNRDDLRALLDAYARLETAARVALLYDYDGDLATPDGGPVAPGTGPFARLRAALTGC